MRRNGLASQKWASYQYLTRLNQPVEPTRWDRLLEELELTDEQALLEVMQKTPKGNWLTVWIFGHERKNAGRRCDDLYVPEAIINALGIEVDVCLTKASLKSSR